MTVTPIAPTQASVTIPDNLRLRDILKTIPKAYFIRDPRKAWTQVAINVALVGFGYWALSIAPWYLLPIVWVFQGTALTGFFVIAHDCGHRSFAKRRWVNDLVGHVTLLPILYPFHSWRLLHDQHHKHTNKMDIDNAWQPFRPELYESFDSATKAGYRAIRKKLWFVGSIAHWARVHFDLSNYRNETDRHRADFSNKVVIIAGLVGLPLLVATTGIFGLVNYFLMPWLVYHFWMSTFTIVHHTLPEIPFKEAHEWDEAQAQLFGTVHCDYPAWVEFMCHKINVHIPHHISTAIPSYNLRLVHNHLKGIWGNHLIEREFNWALVKEITENCHLYHDDRWYQTFDEYEAN